MFLRALLISIILGVLPQSVCADFYRYYDESGGVNVTNDYSSVPERYRSGMVVVRDKELEQKARVREQTVRRERIRQEKLRHRRETENARRAPQESPPTVMQSGPDAPKEPAEAAKPVRRKLGWLERQLPLFKVGVILALIVAAVVFVMRLIGQLVPGTMGTLIRIAMFSGVSVYVFSAYSERVAKAFEVLR